MLPMTGNMVPAHRGEVGPPGFKPRKSCPSTYDLSAPSLRWKPPCPYLPVGMDVCGPVASPFLAWK
jgi:hypothetical protein